MPDDPSDGARNEFTRQVVFAIYFSCMSDALTPEQLRLMFAFFPEPAKQRMELIQNNGRFVHYTRAENALKIIRHKKVWMRKPQWMNDYSEIEHGFQSLKYMLHKGEGGKRFKAALDAALPEWKDTALKPFDQWINSYQSNSYVACVSAHDSRDDNGGRLTMWRAYCPQGDGVAFVLNSSPFTAISDVLGAYSYPVSYRNQQEVDDYFGLIAENIEKESELIKNSDRNMLAHLLHELFRFEMLCTKHGSFVDEREWRIVHSPDRDKRNPQHLQKSVEIIGGAPQPIYSIPLEALPGYDISLPAILERVIIGQVKTGFRDAIFESLCHELESVGVSEPWKLISYSEIPLRLS